MVDSAADHLVYVVPDLELGTARMESRLGVRFTPGGVHPGLGTRNTLLRVGPRTYLEVLGPDPDQPRPSQGLWMGAGGPVDSRLATWCVRGSNLREIATARANGRRLLGPVRSMSRATPDGGRLHWTLTMPLSPLPRGGLVPFLIDWGDTAHPCEGLPDQGVRLTALRGRHPDPGAVKADLSALGVALPVERGAAGLRAELTTPEGAIVVL